MEHRPKAPASMPAWSPAADPPRVRIVASAPSGGWWAAGKARSAESGAGGDARCVPSGSDGTPAPPSAGSPSEPEECFRTLFEEADEAIALADADTGELLDCNQAFCRLSGYERQELGGRPQALLHPPEEVDPSGLPRTFLEHRDGTAGRVFPSLLLTKSGEARHVEISAGLVEVGGRRIVQGFFRDVSDRLRYQHERETTLTLLRLLNDQADTPGLIRSLTGFLREWTGCDAVGVRLREGDDFPYFETRGFPAQFVAAERYLCTRDPRGNLVTDAAGSPLLECMCGNVICGRTSPDKEFFTPKGSFWTNSTSALLAATTEADRQGRTRNRCNGEGYESVALVPLRSGSEVLGLLQVNDRRRGSLTPELVAFLEDTADQIAIALAGRQAQAALAASERRVQHLNQLLRAVRDITALTAHERDPGRILDEACRILVQTRGYVMVWFNRPSQASPTEPVARAGERMECMDELAIWQDVGPAGEGPVAEAFRTRAAVVCNDAASDARFPRWRDAALRCGFRAVASIPVEHADRLLGLMSVCADRADAFDAEELQLLVELAADLALALRNAEHEGERRRSEEQIRAQAALLDLAQDAIIVLDLNDRVWYWNRGAVQLYGWTVDEAVGQDISDLKGPRTPQSLIGRELLLKNGAWAGELQLRTKCGRTVTTATRWTLVRDARGQPQSVLVLDTDITEKKRLEEQFLRAQKLESIGQLAGSVSHDFNNILAAIMLQLSVLRDTPDLSAETIEGLNDLELEAQRAATLTRQLLLFSRRQAAQVQRLDLNHVVRGMVKLLGHLVGEQIRVALAESSSPAWVDADGGMLEQVVMNLCINARDAMPRGGRLGVRLHPVTVTPEEARHHREARAGRFVCLEVTDSGHGMGEETLGRIFEPFFTTKDTGLGTGLGLATVDGIVRQHGGWVTVESVVDRGTTFGVYLPAAEAPAAAPVPTPLARPEEGGTESILIVEDDPAVRRGAVATLARLGYRVLEAGTGLEAMERWERHGGAVDLLLTDMVMPGPMTGLELAERLQQLRPGLKVVISSGYTTDQSGHPLRWPESVTFLAKPYTPQSLAATLRECLGAG
jgi:PAS domain S-box-containing protein